MVRFFMSTLPPCSRGGTVRAASLAIRSNSSEPASRVPRMALSASGGSASGGTRSGSMSMRACSRRFHSARSSAEGALADKPRVLYADEPDVRDVPAGRVEAPEVPDRLVRLGVVVGQEAATVLPGEDASIAPLRVRPREGSHVED